MPCSVTSPNLSNLKRVRRLRSDRRDRQQGGDGRTPESHRVLPVRRARRDRHERRSGQRVPCRHHLPALKESVVTEPGTPPRAAMAEATGIRVSPERRRKKAERHYNACPCSSFAGASRTTSEASHRRFRSAGSPCPAYPRTNLRASVAKQSTASVLPARALFSNRTKESSRGSPPDGIGCSSVRYRRCPVLHGNSTGFQVFSQISAPVARGPYPGTFYASLNRSAAR